MTDHLTRVQAIADQLRPHWPDAAAEIDALIADYEAGRRADLADVKVTIGTRLEKFDGDIAPGKAPVEVIETVETI